VSESTLLDSGLAELTRSQAGFRSCPEFTQALNQYLALMQRWNKRFNLTAIRTLDEMVSKHLLDSLALGPYVTGSEVIDVGSGAGLPGIPLALNFPEKHFLLLDSNGKKTRFLTQVKIELGLDNVEILQCRAESLRDRKFDQVVCRAFKQPLEIYPALDHLLKPSGSILAMVSGFDEDLNSSLSAVDYKFRYQSLTVPFVNSDRGLLILEIPNVAGCVSDDLDSN
jgi:16S rRNA (guanine527-N7)-methyltransferase